MKARILLAAAFCAASPAWGDGTVHVYSWAGYISDQAIADFEAETGIDVTYDTFDSLEALETKILTGRSGYDVIFPSGPVLERLGKLQLLAPLDRSKLPHWSGLDPMILEKLSAHDPDNVYGVPYMWGTVGIGYNVQQVKKRLPEAKLDSLTLLLDPDNAAKLVDCGIGILDSPSEVLAIVLNYLGLPTDSANEAEIDQAKAALLAIRGYIANIRNDNTIDGLASGEVCLQLGYGPDVFAAATAATEGGTGIEVGYFIPREGTIAFFDSMAIPVDAPDPDEAHKFIDFMLRPEVMAENSNLAHAPNAVFASTPMVDPAISGNPALYPPAEIVATLLADKSVPDEVARLRNRAWADIRAGN
jgi:putrescine transport system substrate-binding protein